jgi:hypothetical protein
MSSRVGDRARTSWRENVVTMMMIIKITIDRNVIKKEAENILNCEDLITEIQSMWSVKANVIPVLIGATGIISKSLRQYLSNIPGKHAIKEIQKTAILDTACILRKC